ncbi:MATE family efflux transporter [Selenomonas sp.]|uniref:MATE family efflux transporter n=1 Tax=Selenomonas sp. TaxID=2053611 RepID=UPI002A8218A5|nr:MATE family efflux transporter [Selenomonas sp.]MDY4415480.1 MATE family efflux transporter [Selenomonas sp.]
MRQTFGYREKGKQFFIVLLPIFVTQLAIMATGFFDTVMAGRLSEQDLAGVAIGSNLFFPFFGAFLGIISGLTPVLSNLYGAGKRDKIALITRQGFYWALALAVFLIVFGVLTAPLVLDALALEPRVEEIARGYLAAIACGLPPIFLAGVLRNFIDAHGKTQLTMHITILTVPFNIFFNYVFMYGAFGVPAFGGVGAGIGSAVAFCGNLVLNILAAARLAPFREYHLFAHFPRPDFREWRKQLGLGIPIGATMFCEQSIFGAVALFMTAYGTTVVAAHQAAMNFTTMVYMIPLSVSMALTILVGYETGAKRLKDAAEYTRLARVLTFAFEGSVAICCLLLRDVIADVYTRDADVHALLIVFLFYAVFMQFADSLNAPLQGALRGYKDVRVTFYLAVASYWIIGLPCGHLVATAGGLGPYGYWTGLIAGIFVGAVFLHLRLRRVQRKLAA